MFMPFLREEEVSPTFFFFNCDLYGGKGRMAQVHTKDYRSLNGIQACCQEVL